MSFTYVIEHMEEDEATSNSLPPWVELEYAHMIKFAGNNGRVEFTHLSQSSCSSLDARLSTINTSAASYQVHTGSVLELLEQRNVPITRVCLLDPKAETVLAPEDCKSFDYFLFGGILGDDPPRDRTSELRQLGFPSRHLGPVQMTTDTALGVTKRVIDDKVKLDAIPYIDFPTITFNPKESVEMPFRYIADDGNEPILPPGMRELLHEDLNKSFDF